MIYNIEYFFSKSITSPYVDIEKLPSECTLWWIELNQFSWEYVREIVNNLWKAKIGELKYYDFWYDLTWVTYEYWNTNAVIDYGFWADAGTIEVPFENIYNLLKDWRDYIDAWEEETGLVKK